MLRDHYWPTVLLPLTQALLSGPQLTNV